MFERNFTVLLTHTSRSWEWEKCHPNYLRERYARRGRLDDLPSFESLPPNRNHLLYSGGLTILRVSVIGERAELTAERCIDSLHKIQHACTVGERVVLCFEDFLYVLAWPFQGIESVNLEPGSEGRIDDPWFGGLHTVFPVDSRTVLVSASGSDAALWVDLDRRIVTRRCRLPEQLYGRNYDLTPEMSVQRHYIHNDIQLGHLNCAYPDGDGGCVISTLGQGDIGHFDRGGNYRLLARGYVGCHGVRYAGGESLYFVDSCEGRLMRVNPSGVVSELIRLDSRWLHDAELLADDIYLFSLGDRNELAVIDVSRALEIGRFPLESRGANVQFLYHVPQSRV